MGLSSEGRLEFEIGLLKPLSDRRTEWTTIQRRGVVPKSGGEVLRPFDLLADGVERLASVADQSAGSATLSTMAVRERFPVEIGFSADELETLARQAVSLQVDFYLEDDAVWNAEDEASFVAADGRAWIDCGHRRVLVNLGEGRDGAAIRDAIAAADATLLAHTPRALTFDVYARELGNSVLLDPAELGVLGESRLDLRYVLMPAPAAQRVIPGSSRM